MGRKEQGLLTPSALACHLPSIFHSTGNIHIHFTAGGHTCRGGQVWTGGSLRVKMLLFLTPQTLSHRPGETDTNVHEAQAESMICSDQSTNRFSSWVVMGENESVSILAPMTNVTGMKKGPLTQGVSSSWL